MRRKAMKYAKEYHLTREERIGLAEVILCREVESWKTLSEEDYVRVLDALDGFHYIAHLIAER